MSDAFAEAMIEMGAGRDLGWRGADSQNYHQQQRPTLLASLAQGRNMLAIPGPLIVPDAVLAGYGSADHQHL
ncbi:MAG: hypothetical protein R2710_14610 [Acidimicrobiales bacterium]